jgi:hypothetical protein
MTRNPRSRSRPWQLVLLMVAAANFAGCQGDVTFPTAPVQGGSGTGGAQAQGLVSSILHIVADILPARPLSPDPVGSQTFHLSAEKGGTFTYGRYTLSFPAGAVRGDADVTIAVQDGSVIGCQLSISPASLNGFSKPVRLTMDCRNTTVTPLNSSTLKTYWQVPGGWVDVQGRFDLTTWSQQTDLSHFSNYRAGW